LRLAITTETIQSSSEEQKKNTVSCLERIKSEGLGTAYQVMHIVINERIPSNLQPFPINER
jgi:hypothetical protein